MLSTRHWGGIILALALFLACACDPPWLRNFHEALNAQRAGDYTRSLAAYDRAIKMDGKVPTLYAGRGELNYSHRHYHQAAVDFSRALELRPKHEDYLFRRSLAYAGAGKPRLAKEDLALINAKDPAWAFAQLYYYEKRYDLALSAYDAALKYFPKSLYVPSFYYWSGCCLFKKKNYAPAVARFNGALRLWPRWTEARFMRAWANLRQGDRAAYLRDAAAINRLDPSWELAAKYQKQGVYLYAVTAYSMALELRPNWAQAYLQRGSCYMKMGDKEHARADLRRCLELSPSDRQAQALLKELNNAK